MLTKEANERLTRIGPGTPMGEVMRRYWFPVATVSDLDRDPARPVRILGEQLVLFRTDDGQLGLVQERCPHRGASLAYGIPEDGGLRCCYHGWLFDRQGHCAEQPGETGSEKLEAGSEAPSHLPRGRASCKDTVCIQAYPVQELGGLIFAYLGPAPVPLLPRWDLLVRDDIEREIGFVELPCNWLQIMENSVDPVHTEYLHSRYTNYRLRKQGKPPVAAERHHKQIRFEVFEYGIRKFRLHEGESEDSDDWQLGHPILFPNVLAIGDSRTAHLQFRVPIDDEHTLHFWYWTRPRPLGAPPQDVHDIRVAENPYKEADGAFRVDNVNGQDMMAWVTQGPIADRTDERLGVTDQGIILLRRLWEEQIERVARGEDPIGTVRDPAKNFPMIDIPRERQAFYVAGGYVDSSADLVPTAQHGL
ncbi:MAG TPA: Rieske 2Fe-2S domain-containing protein [Chloroflexota bacterium]|nr:Rieske 2Fe-2S domain-containing protein [Chloroflexota bacterium]